LGDIFEVYISKLKSHLRRRSQGAGTSGHSGLTKRLSIGSLEWIMTVGIVTAKSWCLLFLTRFECHGAKFTISGG